MDDINDTVVFPNADDTTVPTALDSTVMLSAPDSTTRAEDDGIINVNVKNASAFLLAAPDKLTAGAYEDVLRKNSIIAVLEQREPSPYAMVSGAAGPHGASPVNIYVSTEQLGRARELIEAFDSQPIEYKTPKPALNRKSRTSQILFVFIIILIFVIPIGASIYAIGMRIARFFIP
ncbi:MAG: DUF2007 domain-containing protein [Oscillospiraceae bacterium]|nr:DUF2007 domain-containing protein [Oscillospiraceae bacterium]